MFDVEGHARQNIAIPPPLPPPKTSLAQLMLPISRIELCVLQHHVLKLAYNSQDHASQAQKA